MSTDNPHNTPDVDGQNSSKSTSMDVNKTPVSSSQTPTSSGMTFAQKRRSSTR
jgi:hypothetical protein